MFDTFTERGQRILREQYERGWHSCPGSRCYKISCRHCGKEFFAQRPDARYCSYRCTNDAYIQRRRARRAASRQKKCATCGTGFVAQRKDAKYCNNACKQKAYRKSVTGKGSRINAPTGFSNDVTATGSANNSPT